MTRSETQLYKELQSISMVLYDAHQRLQQIVICEELRKSIEFSVREAAGTTFSAYAEVRGIIERLSLPEPSPRTLLRPLR